MGEITKRTSKGMTNPRKIKKLMDNLLQNIDDNVEIRLGDSGATDSYIKFDGAGNLTFYDSTVGSAKTLTQLSAAGGVSTLDEAFDGGKIINGATTSANAMGVGGATDYITFWQEGANDVRIGTTAGANLNISAAGGAIDFNNETLVTTGTLGAGATTVSSLTDGTATLASGTLGGAVGLSNSGAINFKPSGDNDDYIVFQTTTHVPQITTAGGANLNINADGGTIDFGDELLLTTGTLTVQGIVNTTSVIDTTAQLQIGADNVKMTIGASDDTDAYFYFDGAGNLTFYDSALATEVTLSTLASTSLVDPTVTGELTITDGTFIWTDAADEVAGTFTFSNVTNDGIDIVANSATTGNLIHVSSTSVTSGTGVRVDMLESTLNLGLYFEAYDTTGGGAIVWSVGENGVTTIAGSAAGTDAVVVTAGDITLTNGHVVSTDGDLNMDEGKVEVDTTTDETSYIKKNAAGSAAVLEIENTEVTSTGSGILIDQNATGNAIALEITHAGDLAAIDIVASAARTGNVINIPMANQLAQTAIDITGAATGTASEGILHLDLTGALAGNAIRVDSTGTNAATGSLMVLSSTGAQAAATEGICAFFEDTGAASATSYAVSIASTSNEALHVDAGLSLFDERVTITLADDTGPALAITNPDTTGDTNAVTVVPSGAGAGIAITPQEIDTQGLLVTTVASSVIPLIDIDGTTGAGWIGAANVGMMDISGDGTAAHVDSTLVRIGVAGTNVSGQNGMGLRIEDTSTSGGGTEYAMYISSTNNEAIHIDSGIVVVDETVKATAGIITVNAVTDVADPPTQANMDTAFGAGAAGNDGMIGIINDADAGTNAWLCVNTHGQWYYAAKLTVGA